MTDSEVVELGSGTAATAGLGGKGASLARMVADGRPVPPTAVIGADAYRRVVADPELARTLAHLSTIGEPDPDAVDEAFLRVPVPADLAERIVGAARRLGPQIAVRSSGSAEDTPDQSFAGQYTSFLDVPTDDVDELLRAVRLVWASLWHPAPWAYRRAWGIPDADATMAVVLMAMVPAEEAGVVFTADPGGAAGAMRIEAVEGVAEALVSGQRTPTVWLLPCDPDEPVPPEAPAHLVRVRDLAAELATAEDVDLDIEWAWDGERVWLVQSRPVTVAAGGGDGFDTPVDDHELTSEGIGEMLPGVLPPLQWGVASFLVEEAFRSTLASLGALPDDTGATGFVRRVRGRAALDLDLLKASAESIPGSSGADIEGQYFGATSAQAQQPTDRPPRWRLLRRDLRAVAARRQGRFQGDVVVEAVARLRAAPLDLDRLSDSALLSLRLRLLHLGVRAMAAELGIAASAVAAYGKLESVLGRHLEADEAARWAQLVTRGAALPPSPPPGASRSVFAGPTWEEDGAPDWRTTTRPVREEAGRARAELEALLTTDARWRRTRVLSGQVVDVRLHLLRRMITDAVEGLGQREQVKAAVLEIGGQVRHVHLELGRRLVDRGLLPDAADVDLLAEDELRAAVCDRRPVARGMLGRRRRWLANRHHDDLLPSRFRGTPGPGEPSVPPGDRWTGLAASPGRFTGVAVVVDDPRGERPPAGSVLVARATDAAWSPLFVDAGAVVVERGGPLSHAAIVARELGVPAVLDVRGATRVLDGRLVTVDGDRGLVVVHGGDPATGDGGAIDAAVAT